MSSLYLGTIIATAMVVGLLGFNLTLRGLDLADRVRWYRAERGAKRTWLPTRITLPDYHPLYRWGSYNIYIK